MASAERDRRRPTLARASPTPAAEAVQADLVTVMETLQRTVGNQVLSRWILARDKGYEALTGGVGEADAPSEIELPPELTKGLQDAWDKSFPAGEEDVTERAGILVKTKDGGYEWRLNDKPGSSASSTPPYWLRKEGETVVATGHTHPYPKSEGSITGMPESGDDLAGLVTSRERLDTVQSGTRIFTVARSAEFDRMLAPLDMPAKYRLADEMSALFDQTLAAAKGTPQQRNIAAVKAVCAKYHLLFYAGEKGKLKLEGAKVVVKPAAGTTKKELDKAISGAK